MSENKKSILTLALCIATMPPLWAVLAPYIGITTGSIALICAGLYVANGNKSSDGLKISVGFLMGDIWAVLVVLFTELLKFNNEDAELFLVLFVLGAAAVVIASNLPKIVFLPSWLCGWAAALTVLAPVGFKDMGSLPIQVGVAMLVGVWYVGAGIDAVQKLLMKIGKKG